MANIVTLTKLKSHLRYTNPSAPSSDDGALQTFLDAADEVIRFECDDILPKTYTEYHDGGDYTIHLRRVPLISVKNVEEGWGYIAFELDYVEVNSPPPYSLFAYSIDSYENAKITRRSAGNVQIPFRPGSGNIIVEYVAGEETIPGNIVLAELELVAHWWQNSQYRAAVMGGVNITYDASAGTGYTRDTETGSQNLNIGVPYRILELIKSHRHRPIIA